MKTILALVALLTITACHHSLKPNEIYQNNWKKYNLKGKVKSVIECNLKQYVSDIELTTLLSTHISKQYFNFDSVGNCIEITTFVDHENFSDRNTYLYDNAGNYTDQVSYKKDSSLRFKEHYQFDEEGFVLERDEYNDQGKLRVKEEHTYGPHHSFEKLFLSPDGVTLNYRYTYDAMGRRVSQVSYTGDDTAHADKSVWKYNQDSVIEIVCMYKAECIEGVNVYDKNKRLLVYGTIWHIESKEENSGHYKYDANGNVIEYIITANSITNAGSSYRCEYVYDKLGNWVKRTAYKLTGELIADIERKITYY